MDAVAAVRASVDSGAELDTEPLDRLAFDPEAVAAVRHELMPLIMKLVQDQPEVAAAVPEATISALLRGLSLTEVLHLTGTSVESLSDPLVRPLLLAEAADKASQAEAGQSLAVVAQAFALLADASLDTTSVAAIERLANRVPALALSHSPFASLFNGAAELKARLMALNTLLLGRKTVPPIEYLLWSPLESEDGDVLLAALEVDYVGDLVPFLNAQPAIRPSVGPALGELCERYGHGLLDSSIERVLARLAKSAEVLFLELDAKYSLVTAKRPSFIAQLPPAYVVRHHPAIVEQLELSQASLYATANVAQDPMGLRLLPLTASRLLNLPAPSQLLFAAGATASKEGAELFRDRFGDVLRNAYNVPATEENADLRATLQGNLSRWGIRLKREAQVGVV